MKTIYSIFFIILIELILVLVSPLFITYFICCLSKSDSFENLLDENLHL